uniref:C-type lectin 4 n=1 Tax=Anadara kagoshimensis TaxID=1390362 RepID=A0A7G7XXY6_9BIVA|nr:C-type lectin 4 [Anadara sativa]
MYNVYGTFLFLMVAYIISSGVLAANCEPGWREFKNNCYLFNKSKTNWRDARKFCEGKQASLATVTSLDKHNYITEQIILEDTSHTWIGGNDIGREGLWVWERTGEHFKFTKWHTGQPDNDKNNGHCLLMDAGYGFAWNDITCVNSYSFVCEKPSKTASTCQEVLISSLLKHCITDKNLQSFIKSLQKK